MAFAPTLILPAQPSFAHDALVEQIARLTIEIARDPANAELFVRRAELYRARRQWKAALGDLDHALQLDPKLAAAHLTRGRVFFETDQPRAAIQAVSRFLERHPRHVDALVVRARSRAAIGQIDEAAGDYARALETRPVPDLYIERARTILRSSRARNERNEEALRNLDDGIRRLGSIVTLELEAIDIELTLKRYDAALTRLDRVSAQAARQDTWLARRGAILEKAGRIDEAREAYHVALALATSLSARQSRASRALIEQLRAHLDRLRADTASHEQKHDQ